ncbi:kinase-like domain-containing protein [Xylariaceae sp. FL1272]|nr:kinase-like domain-containing protein [Xylariaceae sp. FL1272]
MEQPLCDSRGRGARIWKIRPHVASGLSDQKSIVMKSYRKDRYWAEFKNEVTTYRTIVNMRKYGTLNENHFLDYYGCFVQGSSCILLMEYAEKGSLSTFWADHSDVPRTIQEAKNLWHDLEHLVTGLSWLHNGGIHKSNIHQDIKPDNIFVSENPSKPGRLLFRFGDFGMTSQTTFAENGETTGPWNSGTKMYSSPELAQIHEGVGMNREVGWPSDVFSLGCVLLEFAVWMSLHERGRVTFEQERINATSDDQRVKDAGYQGAFHNGYEILPIVEEKILEITAIGRTDSSIAQLCSHMMNFIQEQMLHPKDTQRLTAQQLTTKFLTALEKHQPSPIYPDGTSEPLSSPNPRESLLYSKVSTPGRTNSTTKHYDQGVDKPSRGNGRGLNDHVSYDYSLTGHATSGATSNDHPAIDQLLPERVPTFERSSAPTVSHLSSPSYEPIASWTHGASQRDTRLSNGYTEHSSHDSDSILKAPELPISLEHAPIDSVTKTLDWIAKDKGRQADTPSWVKICQTELSGRDIYIVIDNSASMSRHWPCVKDTARVLLYITKSVDPDGVDIRMTNGDAKVKKVKNEKSIFDNLGYFDAHCPKDSHRQCNMEGVLSDILDDAISKAKRKRISLTSNKIKGISVYVLTNGIWSPPRADAVDGKESGGVHHAIDAAIKRLRDNNRMRTYLAVQFIRFGDDPTGIRRMNYLDNGLQKDWDIVDTVAHTGSVEKMLIGPLKGDVDDKPADSNRNI